MSAPRSAHKPVVAPPRGVAERALPSLVLTARGAVRVRQAQPLVYRVDAVGTPSTPGDVVHLSDPRGGFLGTALYCARGPVVARVLSREAVTLDRALLTARIAAAAARRRALYEGLLPARDAYRVVHGEADLLPGLILDRYGDAVVVQVNTAALDAREADVLAAVQAALSPRLVVVRNDGSARDLEELPRHKSVHPLDGRAEADTRVRFHDAGTELEADLYADRKTGSFLDQQENHALAAEYARRVCPGGRALDTFSYHGGFALALARAGLRVLACDEDPAAVARARENARRSDLPVDFRAVNAFDLLRALEADRRRFEVVVLDPPALAKRGHGQGHSAAAHAGALRAYKELNLRALRLLEPGGLLVTCSCSGRVGPAEFGAMLDEAARDVGRSVQILERRGAGRDHPTLLGMPESEYLKCWVLQVID